MPDLDIWSVWPLKIIKVLYCVRLTYSTSLQFARIPTSYSAAVDSYTVCWSSDRDLWAFNCVIIPGYIIISQSEDSAGIWSSIRQLQRIS